MPRERLSMREIREVLRLRLGCGLSKRKIAKSCAISRPTVSEYLRRAEASGLGWPLPRGVDEAELERRLFPAFTSHGRGKCPQPYEYAEWKKARVNIDYHVEVDRHYYSAPYELVKQTVDVRLSGSTVELFHKGKRVASHCRSYQTGRHTTVRKHMPLSHRRYLEWSPSRILDWASKTGPATAKLAERILLCRPYPQQGYRSCLGLLRLAKAYGSGRLEAACARALCLGAYSYRQPLPGSNDKPAVSIKHDNIRGSQYYN